MLEKSAKQDFIHFLLTHRVLTFGQFTLKSGRISPYFFQLGQIYSGEALYRLGLFYAEKLIQSGLSFDGLWAPPYKGIPIATATAIALDRDYQHPTTVSSYRKEIKDHGEGGFGLGAPLTGRLVLIDDVVTAGTAFREALTQFTQGNQQSASLVAMIIALDREEKGSGQERIVNEIMQDYQIPVFSLIHLTDILTYIQDDPTYAQHLEAMLAYKESYG